MGKAVPRMGQEKEAVKLEIDDHAVGTILDKLSQVSMPWASTGPPNSLPGWRASSTCPQGPFIFNLGHGILPQTPIEHVEQMLERIRG